MTVQFIGIDGWKCAVHNEPTVISLGKMTCAKWTAHTDLTHYWVGKSRTREIGQMGRDLDLVPMYVEGDNGMIFKHRAAGWWPPHDREQQLLHRRVVEERRRLQCEPTKYVHLISRRPTPTAWPVFDVYGPTLADADSVIQRGGPKVRDGIAEAVRVGRDTQSSERYGTWAHVAEYRVGAPVPSGLPPKLLQKEIVKAYWYQQDLLQVQANLSAMIDEWVANESTTV